MISVIPFPELIPYAVGLLERTSFIFLNRQVCLTNFHHAIVGLQPIVINVKQILDSGFENLTEI